jgi:hypothetical protein
MFYLNWKQDGKLVRGFDAADGSVLDGQVMFPISFPQVSSPPRRVTLSTSACQSNLEVASVLSLYLTGNPDDVAEVQCKWPYAGGLTEDGVHLLPGRDGGVEISFDDGRSWKRFAYIPGNTDGANFGYEKDPSTWVLVPVSAFGAAGTDGMLGPFDQADMLVRFVVPPSVSNYRVLDVRLGISTDIL